MLTDTDLTNIICRDRDWPNKNKLHLFPCAEDSITPAGYDLRVGNQCASAMDADIIELKEGDFVSIRPGDTVLISTLEDVGMPQNRSISGLITSKVSMVSRGLCHISTNVDADWKGNLLIALHNPSKTELILSWGQPFCTISFFENKTPSTKDCDKEPGRKDILLTKFIQDMRATKEKTLQKYLADRKRSNWKRLFIAASVSIIGGLYYGSTPGFPATVAIGLWLANLVPVPEKAYL